MPYLMSHYVVLLDVSSDISATVSASSKWRRERRGYQFSPSSVPLALREIVEKSLRKKKNLQTCYLGSFDFNKLSERIELLDFNENRISICRYKW